MTEPIEMVMKQHRFALELLISKYELDSENMLRLLRNMVKNLQDFASNKGKDREGDGEKRSESG